MVINVGPLGFVQRFVLLEQLGLVVRHGTARRNLGRLARSKETDT
jgi:hypothetical protein